MNYLRRRALLPVTGFDTVKERWRKREAAGGCWGGRPKPGGEGGVGGWMEGRREKKGNEKKKEMQSGGSCKRPWRTGLPVQHCNQTRQKPPSTFTLFVLFFFPVVLFFFIFMHRFS